MHMGKAAKLLGVGRSTLYRRLLEMGIIAKGDGADAAKESAKDPDS